MKGIRNRQKIEVRAREGNEKYLMRAKALKKKNRKEIGPAQPLRKKSHR